MAITLEQAQKLNGTTIEFGPRQVRFSLWIKESHQRLYVNNQAGKALACMDLVSGQWIQVRNTGVDAEWRAALELRIADMFQPVAVEAPEVVAVTEAPEVITAPEVEVTWSECRPVQVQAQESDYDLLDAEVPENSVAMLVVFVNGGYPEGGHEYNEAVEVRAGELQRLRFDPEPCTYKPLPNANILGWFPTKEAAWAALRSRYEG